eukprot:827414-Alexandrium_andersonii.AAC.1
MSSTTLSVTSDWKKKLPRPAERRWTSTNMPKAVLYLHPQQRQYHRWPEAAMSGFILCQALAGMTVPHWSMVLPMVAVQMYHDRRVPTPEADHSSSYWATRKQ